MIFVNIKSVGTKKCINALSNSFMDEIPSFYLKVE
jgi:hypothetical protein